MAFNSSIDDRSLPPVIVTRLSTMNHALLDEVVIRMLPSDGSFEMAKSAGI